MILLSGFAPATGCLIYHNKDSPITHIGLLLVLDVHLPSPFSLPCGYQPSPLFLSFLCITLYPFRLWTLAVFSISCSVASFFLLPATPGSISAYFFYSLSTRKIACW